MILRTAFEIGKEDESPGFIMKETEAQKVKGLDSKSQGSEVKRTRFRTQTFQVLILLLLNYLASLLSVEPEEAIFTELYAPSIF